jgi:hypothetical protein
MAKPPNPAMVPILSYENIFCLPSSEWHWPPVRWKTRGLLSGSCTSGTIGHRLQPKNLDTTGSLQPLRGEEEGPPT